MRKQERDELETMNRHTEDVRAHTLEWIHRVLAYSEHTQKHSRKGTGSQARASDATREPASSASYRLEQQPSDVRDNMIGT